MPKDLINLDELESLNPDPQVFLVAGRELVLRELPHKQFFQAQQLAQEIQTRYAAADFDVGELEELNKRLLTMLYGSVNDWLTPDFWDGLSARKIVYLTKQAFEHNQSGMIEQAAELGLTGDDGPPALAAARAAAQRHLGGQPTKS